MKIDLPKNTKLYYDSVNNKYIFSYLGTDYVLDDISKVDTNNMLKLLNSDCLVNATNTLYEGFKELHHHDFYEILYIKKGNFIFKVDEQIYNVSPGDVLLISPLTLHVLTQDQNVDAQRIVINVTEKYINSISSEKSNLLNVFTNAIANKNYRIHLSNESRKKLDSYIDVILNTQTSDKFGDDILFKIKFAQLLLLLNDHQEEVLPTDLINQNKIVSDCVAYITDNLQNQISIEDISLSLNVSPSTISHTFKEQTGMSIYRFITKKRMILAKKLIRENFSLKNIYQLCGFNDYTSFFRCFKKEFNTTPKDFKNAPQSN